MDCFDQTSPSDHDQLAAHHIQNETWTPCEEHGHRFSFDDGDGEVFGQCLDCGEPRED